MNAWCKKIKGRFYYFGPDKDAALDRYVEVKNDLAAGREPRPKAGTLTLREPVNHFLSTKRDLVESGELQAGHGRLHLVAAYAGSRAHFGEPRFWSKGRSLRSDSTFGGRFGVNESVPDPHSDYQQSRERGRYDAFGNKVADAGTFVNPVGYRGERFDHLLDQYYLRARYYDPAAGRFNSMDSWTGSLSNPQTLHRYAYAHKDGVNLSDPTGWFAPGRAPATGSLRVGRWSPKRSRHPT